MSARRVYRPFPLAVAYLLAAVLAGCTQPIAGSAAPAAPTGAQPSSPSSVPRSSGSSVPVALGALEGVWEGTYICNQGKTGLRLIIKAAESGSVPAILEFFPTEDNKQAKSGSYAMRGSVVGGDLVFRAQRWIDQPGSYVMVDLVVRSVTAGKMTGKVDGPNCTTFTVQRK